MSFAPPAVPSISFGLLKYSGGGDWYNDVNSLKNLAEFCNRNMGTNISNEFVTIEPGSQNLFSQPITYMTGHGNVIFSDAEAANMRQYLIGGGFLIINDDYGMDPYIRPALKKIFPELSLVEIPANHPIYNSKYPFPQGLPKIHEHDGKPAQAFGLFWEKRLVALYDFESDLGDGWDDVHGDPFELRLKALKMGANIVKYAFTR
ncbi:MAG TPA: DUF4159 domain-containing protein [Saprospiraceae bacterium]|nr:DUF4159 domain-containing protein [Saprospiraceae bacterium]